MKDGSYINAKHFIDNQVYNCPYCNKSHVAYKLERTYCFNWNNEERCFVYFVECKSCRKTSMHLSYEDITDPNCIENQFKAGIDIDSYMFYSAPSPHFALDERISMMIEDLVN